MGDRDYFQRGFGGGEFGGGPRGEFFAQYRGTKIAIITLVAMQLLTAIIYSVDFDAYNTLMRVFALNPERVLHGWIWQLLTMALFHAPDILHLLFNCIILWFFGRMVETRLTTKQFFGFCAGSAVVGSLFYVAWALVTGSAASAYGASGVCMGLTLLAAAWYPRAEILFFFVLRMQLWVLAAILVVMDLLGTLYGSPGVAFTAHLGGAAYGWIYFKYGRRIEGVFSKIDEIADESARKKELKNRAKNAELRGEIDRILDKVNRDGMASLTDAEKKFLKSASKKLG